MEAGSQVLNTVSGFMAPRLERSRSWIFVHDAILHRLDVRQAEKGAGLLGRAGHFDIYFHGLLSVFPSLGDLAAPDHVL